MLKADSSIYVAGHTGLVGRALISRLRARGYVNLVTCPHGELDLTRQAETEQFFARKRPEFVFFAAGRVGGIVANSTYRADFIYENMAMATNVIHSAYRFGVKRLLNFGSSCIYPKHAPQPIREEYLLSGGLEPTNEPYAVAKISAIKLCQYFNEQYGTDFISVMPTNLYGPYDNFNLETAHVAAALMRKFHLAKLLARKDYEGVRQDLVSAPVGFHLDPLIRDSSMEGLETMLGSLGVGADEVVLWGTGEPLREFLFVDDLADACIFLMEHGDGSLPDKIVNIGFGCDVTIRELADLLKELVGFEGSVRFDSTRPDGMARKLLHTGRLGALGWQARTSLRKGLQATYGWYLTEPVRSR